MPHPPTRFPTASLRLGLATLIIGVICAPIDAAEKSSSYLAALESITANELRHHVDYLADGALAGRYPGAPGGRAAGDYLAEQFAALGLRGAGTDGGFFQHFRSGYRNVLALIPGSDPQLASQLVVVGAHYDHVGHGNQKTSRGPIGPVHNGADDNASGTSALLELAEALSMLPEAPKRSILLIAFDAEEIGLFGSKHWVAHPTMPLTQVAAMINLDMIGRLRDDRLTVFGSRSGYGLRRLISCENDGPNLVLDFSWETKRNSDAHAFLSNRVPAIFLHTGLHDDYHTPRDDARLINSNGMSRIVRLLFGITYELANRPEKLPFRSQVFEETESARRRLEGHRPRLADRLGVGFRDEDPLQPGVLVTRVTLGMPADQAGVRAGDRIVRFDGREVRTGNDLSAAVRSATSPASMQIQRRGEDAPLELSAQLRGNPMRLGVTWRTDDAEPGTVVLTHIVGGSPADKAGLREGDRIYQLAGCDFRDDTEFARLAATLPGPLQVLVEREGQILTVVLRLEVEPLEKAA